MWLIPLRKPNKGLPVFAQKIALGEVSRVTVFSFEHYSRQKICLLKRFKRVAVNSHSAFFLLYLKEKVIKNIGFIDCADELIFIPFEGLSGVILWIDSVHFFLELPR